MKSKLLKVIALSGLVFGLSACGESSSVVPSSSQTPTSEAPQTSETPSSSLINFFSCSSVMLWLSRR